MSEQETAPRFEQWAIVELMGHVRLGGRVTEESHFGTALGRIDVPTKDGGFTTQYFSGTSIYRLTPTTEDVARAVALHNEPEPVHRWELPAPKPARAACRGCGDTDTALDEDGYCLACDPGQQG